MIGVALDANCKNTVNVLDVLFYKPSCKARPICRVHVLMYNVGVSGEVDKSDVFALCPLKLQESYVIIGIAIRSVDLKISSYGVCFDLTVLHIVTADKSYLLIGLSYARRKLGLLQVVKSHNGNVTELAVKDVHIGVVFKNVIICPLSNAYRRMLVE